MRGLVTGCKYPLASAHPIHDRAHHSTICVCISARLHESMSAVLMRVTFTGCNVCHTVRACVCACVCVCVCVCVQSGMLRVSCAPSSVSLSTVTPWA